MIDTPTMCGLRIVVVWWSLLLLSISRTVTLTNAFVFVHPSQTSTIIEMASSSSSSTLIQQQQRIGWGRSRPSESPKTVLLLSLPISEKDSSDDHNDNDNENANVEESHEEEFPRSVSEDGESDTNDVEVSSSSNDMMDTNGTFPTQTTDEITTSTTTTTTTAPSLSSSSLLKIETDMIQIEQLQVQTSDCTVVTVGHLMGSVTPKTKTSTVIVSCLSHYGDFNAWELTQQYMTAIQDGRLDEDWYVPTHGDENDGDHERANVMIHRCDSCFVAGTRYHVMDGC
jgi:hypothetical protein